MPSLSWATPFLLGSALAAPATRPDPAAPLDRAMASAEASLRDGELQAAESHYRTALLEAWLLEGSLAAAAGRLTDARDAFRRASASAVENRPALLSLALVQLQMAEPSEAVKVLTPLAGRNAKDTEARRLLAQALLAGGQPEQAVQELEEARTASPGDLELDFTLASGYLRLKKVDAAQRLFAQVARAKPIAQTHVLIGRTYRDFGEYEQAETELRAALSQDPAVRRAHYYLGTVALLGERRARLDEAISEFQKELRLAPGDRLASLYLGMALVEARRPSQALPHLERAARADPPPVDALHYLGRAQLALGGANDAVTSLRRALELARARGPASDPGLLRSVHYQLALALRQVGQEQEAVAHFAEAERASAQAAETARERLASYLAGSLDRESRSSPMAPAESALSGLGAAERQALEGRARAALTRAYLNLGVMQAQRQRFARAAALFASAAAIDPGFPQVQYSLGVAYFNAQQFDKAAPPLARALETRPAEPGLRRMLALSWLNTEAYEKAAELLGQDPEREADPSLQYAYGLSLVRSGRAAEAQAVFGRLLARHGESPDLSVVIGQASAQQGDYEGAIQALQRALSLQPTVAEANATLGIIYLKQGKLAEAEQALRAELAAHPDAFKARHDLAAVLDLEGRPEEAQPLLRAVLKTKPDFAGARYLLGKILLAQGAAAEAVEHLEAAARLAPDEANIRYQLGQAYQKLGRADLAQQQFEVFRQLKDKRRGSLP